VRPPGLAASSIVGAWRLTVNADSGSTVVTFGSDGGVATTDPGMGVWSPRTAGPGDIEGVWIIPVAGLTVTFVIAVVDVDRFVGTGLAADTAAPAGRLHPITMSGVRVMTDPATLAQVAPPRT